MTRAGGRRRRSDRSAKHAGKARRRPPRSRRPTAAQRELAEKLAWVACRTLYAGTAKDAAFLRDMRKGGKGTPALRRLARRRTPPAVRRWVAKECFGDGPVREAVASVLAVALARFGASAPGPSPASHEPGHWDCWPACPPPGPP